MKTASSVRQIVYRFFSKTLKITEQGKNGGRKCNYFYRTSDHMQKPILFWRAIKLLQHLFNRFSIPFVFRRTLGQRFGCVEMIILIAPFDNDARCNLKVVRFSTI